MSQRSYTDLQAGDRFVGPGRTLTEADLTFACMASGDWHPIHADEVFARGTSAGGRLFHGGYGVLVALGSLANLLEFAEPIIGVLNLREWAFRAPLRVGDTVQVELEIVGKRVTSDGQRAIVERRVALLNQDGVAVQQGFSDVMLQLSPAEAVP